MNPRPTLRSLVFLLSALVIVALPAAAAKRRAVRHSARLPRVEAVVQGTVVDDVTGLPVNNAKVSAGKSDTTDEQGLFRISSAYGYGAVDVSVTRTGYLVYKTTVGAGEHTMTVRLTPTATVEVKMVSGTQYQLDRESIGFGYPVAFGGYPTSEVVEFCNGTEKFEVDSALMKRIIGPATFVTLTTCCANYPTMKTSIEMRGQAPAEYFFADSCKTDHPIHLVARDHVTGEKVYLPLTEVQEVVFP